MSEALSTCDPAGVAQDYNEKCLAAQMRLSKERRKGLDGQYVAVWFSEGKLEMSSASNETEALLTVPDTDFWLIFKYQEGYWRLVLDRSFVGKLFRNTSTAVEFAAILSKNWESPSPALTFAS